jgi:hypothetical protein
MPRELPDVTQLEGRFTFARSTAGQFMEVLDYLSISTVTAVDENIIELSAAGAAITGTFLQVEPYVFHLIDFDHPMMLALTAEQLHFIMEDGHPVQIHLGNPFNLIAMPRSMPSLITSASIAVASTLFFVIAPIVLLVIFLRNKKKGITPTRASRLNSGLLLCGMLLVVNNLAMLARVFVINMFRTASELAPHIWINYLLAGLAVLMFIGLPVSLRQEEVITTKRKVFYMVTTLFVALLIFVLYSWNFFVTL